MKQRFEYKELTKGKPTQEFGNKFYSEQVTVEDINNAAKEGWRFVSYASNGKTAILEREVSRRATIPGNLASKKLQKNRTYMIKRVHH